MHSEFILVNKYCKCPVVCTVVLLYIWGLKILIYDVKLLEIHDCFLNPL